MNMFRKNKKGFTLIELIVVIAILAILAAIAIPTFIGITNTARDTVNQTNASQIATAYNAYQALNPNTPLAGEKTSFANVGALETAIGVGLWPKGLSATDATVAFEDWLIITGGVANVVALTSASAGT